MRPTMRPKWRIFAAALLLMISTSERAGARLFEPQAFTLANGLQVVVVSDHRVPVVSHMVWYLVGAADEEPGRSGLAHLLEHLMFKGTPQVPQGEFSRIVGANGGRENAFTSYDYTAYYQDIAKDRLELVMRMEADRMANLVLTEAQVTPEKLVVLEERRKRVDNQPASILDEEAQAVSYLNHPYRRPVIGWAHEVEGLTADDAMRFYRRWYAPNNAIVVVSGDVSAADVRPIAERTYGRLERTPLPPRPELREPEQHASRRITLTDARVRQPSWTRSWPAPSYRTGAVEHAYPLQVLEDILGGGETGRLYRKLVVERSLAVSASAWYDPSARGPSMLQVSASPRSGVGANEIEAAVDDVVREILDRGLSEDEVGQAKRRLAADAIYARDSYGTAARMIGEALSTGQTLSDVEAWPERIAQVTRARVEAAARDILAKPTVTSILLGSGETAADEESETAPRPPPSAAGTAIR